VANNVANANTPGYTEERPNWQENQPVTINGVSYGDGVTETGATSLRDRVLEQRLDQQQQLALVVERAANGSELGSGAFCSRFRFAEFDGRRHWQRHYGFLQVLCIAGGQPIRQRFAGGGAFLGDHALRRHLRRRGEPEWQRAALDQEASGVTSQVNSLTSAIGQLNQQIQTASSDANAGALEDQRQEDLSQLSQLVGINQITTENNGLSVTTTGGQLLVSGDSSFQLTSGSVGGMTHFFVGNTDITAQLATGGGELAGT